MSQKENSNSTPGSHTRHLVTSRRVASVRSLNARHEVVRIDGWESVTGRGEFSSGELVLYFEIESLVPQGTSGFPWDYGNVIKYPGPDGNRADFGYDDYDVDEKGYWRGWDYHHVRSRMYGTQLSQGVVCKLSDFEAVLEHLSEPGNWPSIRNRHTMDMRKAVEEANASNLASLLSVIKFERDTIKDLLGSLAAEKPAFLPHAAYERIQSNPNQLYRDHRDKYLVTEKLDGLSTTLYIVKRDSKWCTAIPGFQGLDEAWQIWLREAKCAQIIQDKFKDHFIGFATQSKSISPSTSSVAWRAIQDANLPFLLLQVARRMRIHNLVLQGELIGPTIRPKAANALIDHHAFFAFGLYDIAKQQHVPARTELEELKLWKVPCVPFIGIMTLGALVKGQPDGLEGDDNFVKMTDKLLRAAEGKSKLNSAALREGLVFRALSGDFWFKIISNEWLRKARE
jgi:hypothetical protein